MVSKGARSPKLAETNVVRLPVSTLKLPNVSVPKPLFRPATNVFAEVKILKKIRKL